MRTRAKFYVTGLTMLPGTAAIKVTLSAVSRGDRNTSWAQATPSGIMEMHINNPLAVEAWEQFMRAARETGRQPEVFLDIYPSTDGWPGDGHLFREADFEPGTYGHGKCGECGLDKDGPAHPNG